MDSADVRAAIESSNRRLVKRQREQCPHEVAQLDVPTQRFHCTECGQKVAAKTHKAI